MCLYLGLCSKYNFTFRKILTDRFLVYWTPPPPKQACWAVDHYFRYCNSFFDSFILVYVLKFKSFSYYWYVDKCYDNSVWFRGIRFVGCLFESQPCSSWPWKSPVSTVHVMCIVWVADKSGSKSMKKQTLCPTVGIKLQQTGRRACALLKWLTLFYVRRQVFLK
jgi:hypothetical protein